MGPKGNYQLVSIIHFVFFVGARSHQFIAKMDFLISLKCTIKKQSDGALRTIKKHLIALKLKHGLEPHT